MSDLGGGLRLLREAPLRIGTLRDLGVQHLHGELLAHGDVRGPEDRAHATLPEELLEPVLRRDHAADSVRGGHDESERTTSGAQSASRAQRTPVLTFPLVAANGSR